jgi:hypothetical protein
MASGAEADDGTVVPQRSHSLTKQLVNCVRQARWPGISLARRNAQMHEIATSDAKLLTPRELQTFHTHTQPSSALVHSASSRPLVAIWCYVRKAKAAQAVVVSSPALRSLCVSWHPASCVAGPGRVLRAMRVPPQLYQLCSSMGKRQVGGMLNGPVLVRSRPPVAVSASFSAWG